MTGSAPFLGGPVHGLFAWAGEGRALGKHDEADGGTPPFIV
ncbi:hypothetical protein [Megasphaera sp. ASD88]|nr:hypothetical protein [Megasphaera sp. ASD88]